MTGQLPAPALRTSEEARAYFDSLPVGDGRRGPAHDSWMNALEREGKNGLTEAVKMKLKKDGVIVGHEGKLR